MAATYEEKTLTLEAGEDLSAAQLYIGVKIDNTGRVVQAGAGEQAIGVLVSQGGTGTLVSVALFAGSSVVKVRAGAAFQEGIDLMVEGTTGHFITATSTNFALVKALDPGVDGEVIRAIPLSGYVTA